MKTFNQSITTEANTVMIVDSLNLAFRWKHSGQLNFVDDFQRTVDSLRRSYKAGKVIIASDMGSSYYRKNLFPEYKGNRKDKQALQSPEEELAFQLFLEEFIKVLEKYKADNKYPVLRFSKVEADDIAAYIVNNRKKYGIDKIVLVSSDRDWDLLISEHVMRFSYVTTKETRLDNWNEHYECEPDEYISIKCLQGDTGDNVPGVPGIGPKTALKLVKQYGTAYDIAANIPIDSKYKYIQNLNAFGADALLLNYRLMDLVEFSHEALGIDNCKIIDEKLKEYMNDNNS